jgi:hypothetical protein
VNFCFHHIIFMWFITLNVSLVYLAEIVFIRFLLFILFPPFPTILLEGNHYVQPTLKELCTTSLRANIYINYLKFFQHGRFISSPFIYLCNHLFISTWAHRYLFYTLGYNLMLLYFVAQIVLAFAIGSYFLLSPKSFWHTPSFYHVFNFWHCKMFQAHLSFLYIFSFTATITYFFSESWFLLLKSCIRKQDLGPSYICC